MSIFLLEEHDNNYNFKEICGFMLITKLQIGSIRFTVTEFFS